MLTSWGVQTLGMLADLPETQLIARLGQAGKRLRQLARGEAPHLFVPIEPEFKLSEHVGFDAPVESLDSLLFVLNAMLGQLIERASMRSLALATVIVTLVLDDRSSYVRTVRPALPANDRQLWTKLIHLDLEGHPPHASILSVSLSAEPGRTSKVQLGLFSPQLPEPNRLDVTLARIRAIVGDERVGSPVLQDTHRTEAFRVHPFTVIQNGRVQSGSRPFCVRRQLRPPEMVSVKVSQMRPAAIGFRTKRYDVQSAYGPWATAGGWWSSTQWNMEEWDVIARSDDGQFLCGCLVHDLDQHVYRMAALYD